MICLSICLFFWLGSMVFHFTLNIPVFKNPCIPSSTGLPPGIIKTLHRNLFLFVFNDYITFSQMKNACLFLKILRGNKPPLLPL